MAVRKSYETQVKKVPRPHAADLRAAGRLLVDATHGVTDVVEELHRTIASGPGGVMRPLVAPLGVVYSSIRGVTRAVGVALDALLEQLAPVLGESAPGPERLAAMAVLNGVLGDHLERSGNPLAQPMQLIVGGSPPRPQLVVFVHGSAMNELQWKRNGHDHGAALARDMGCSVVYARYNSGLHISTNGARLAAELERLVAVWPVEVESLTLVGHSMGGLVARSACDVATRSAHRWRTRLRALVTLGAPHEGAPLERSGNWLETLLGVSRYSAPLARLGKLRSEGVTDLRFGYVSDADWQGCDRFELGPARRHALAPLRGVECFAVAATRSPAPAKRLRSDGLVPVESALGFPAQHEEIVYGAGHLDLLERPEVYAVIRRAVAVSGADPKT